MSTHTSFCTQACQRKQLEYVRQTRLCLYVLVMTTCNLQDLNSLQPDTRASVRGHRLEDSIHTRSSDRLCGCGMRWFSQGCVARCVVGVQQDVHVVVNRHLRRCTIRLALTLAQVSFPATSRSAACCTASFARRERCSSASLPPSILVGNGSPGTRCADLDPGARQGIMVGLGAFGHKNHPCDGR
jgi:hypothetical protein